MRDATIRGMIEIVLTHYLGVEFVVIYKLTIAATS
jgi:hypothetical protein